MKKAKYTALSPVINSRKDLRPARSYSGAGMDPSAVNGAMLVCPDGSVWGIKVLFYSGSKLVDEKFADYIRSYDSYAPDGSVSQVTAGPLILSWVRCAPSGIIGSVIATEQVKLIVECYVPFMNCAEFEAGEDIHGKSTEILTYIPDYTLYDNVPVPLSRRHIAVEGTQSPFVLRPYTKPTAAETEDDRAYLTYVLSANDSLYFYAGAGMDALPDRVPSAEQAMEKMTQIYERMRRYSPTGTSGFGANAANALTALMWQRVYDPHLKHMYFTPERSQAADNWQDRSGWGESGAAFAAAYTGVPSIFCEHMQVAAEDDFLAPLALWFGAARLGVYDGLDELYTRLKQSCRPADVQLNTAGEDNNDMARRMYGSPLHSDNGCWYSLDAYCAKAWNTEAMAKLANMLGYYNDEQAYTEAYERLKALIDETFWNEKQGAYMSRGADGAWASATGVTSLYPLLAGVPDMRRAERLLKLLADPKRLFSERGIPTVSKMDLSLEQGRQRLEKHTELWRTAICPICNYLVYMGLVRYGFDAEAAALAQKAGSQWQRSMQRLQMPEHYMPDTGNIPEGASKRHVWGVLLALMGLNQLIDADVYNGGITLGTLAGGTHNIDHLIVGDSIVSADVSPNKTTAKINGEPIISITGGSCRITGLELSDGGVSFKINAPVELEADTKFSLRFTVPAGRSRVQISNGNVNVYPSE